MSYDPNSLEARKGKLGEQIVKTLLERNGAVVTRPDGLTEDEASLIDFHAKPAEGSSFVEQLVEVKVRKAMDYAYGQATCYAFSAVQVKRYMKYAKEHDLPLTLWIVDPSRGTISAALLSETLGGLEYKAIIDGREFPFTQETTFGALRYYHANQFVVYPLSEADKQKFGALKQTVHDEPEKAEQGKQSPMLSLFPEGSATAPPCTATTAPAKQNTPAIDSFPLASEKRTITAPNGSQIGIWGINNEDGEFFLDFQIWQAIGYVSSFDRKSAFAKAMYGDTQLRKVVTPTKKRVPFSYSFAMSTNDAADVLRRYIALTYGAKQGTKKFNRHMTAAGLLDFLKSEGFT